MIPWKLLGKARTPGEGVELCLYQRDDEFSIKVDNDEVMNSRAYGSEEALAWHACQKIASRPRAQWRPEWKVDLHDAADTQAALGFDALRSIRAIRTPRPGWRDRQ